MKKEFGWDLPPGARSPNTEGIDLEWERMIEAIELGIDKKKISIRDVIDFVESKL